MIRKHPEILTVQRNPGANPQNWGGGNTVLLTEPPRQTQVGQLQEGLSEDHSGGTFGLTGLITQHDIYKTNCHSAITFKLLFLKQNSYEGVTQ